MKDIILFSLLSILFVIASCEEQTKGTKKNIVHLDKKATSAIYTKKAEKLEKEHKFIPATLYRAQVYEWHPEDIDALIQYTYNLSIIGSYKKVNTVISNFLRRNNNTTTDDKEKLILSVIKALKSKQSYSLASDFLKKYYHNNEILNNPRLSLVFAVLLRYSNNCSSAIQIIEPRSKHITNIETVNSLALCYIHLKSPQKAYKVLKKYVKNKQANQYTREYYAISSGLIGNYKESLKYLKIDNTAQEALKIANKLRSLFLNNTKKTNTIRKKNKLEKKNNLEKKNTHNDKSNNIIDDPWLELKNE